MTIVDFLIIVLATTQIVETWHHGSIFQGARAEMDARAGGFIPDLMTCMFCLSHWVAAAVVVAWAWNPFGVPQLVLTAFAATRGAQLTNDLTKRWCRTPDQRNPPEQASHEQNKQEEGPSEDEGA